MSVHFWKFCCLLILVFMSHAHASSERLDFESHGFVGQYTPSSVNSNKVPVLVLGGSEGGVPNKLAQVSIDAGFPTLALAYFNSEGLPHELENIPVEYIDTAINWLLAQPNVQTDKLMVVGWSKGAELALLIASRDSRISRVVAIAPSSVIWAGILQDWTKVPNSSWTEHGTSLQHVSFNPTGPINGLVDLYTQSLDNRNDQSRADIPVQDIAAQVLLMSGKQDEIWPATRMAEQICQQMNSNVAGQCQHISYDKPHLLDYEFLDSNTQMNQSLIKHLNL
ncbi:acyl-CoA thioester hydrolase/BAAT C-terminal domain-containing protein [Shewanella maritima]|uniref:acyl-CoA thioester hydrolase/BAAT C-terminal domain-containing protein n=1 Tax=Shewanella maritima TaxID=2520507 RepID=UPI003736EFC2